MILRSHVATRTRKEMLVTLSNESGFSLSEHFERLAHGGAISSFELDGNENDYLKKARIVLADGVECEVTIVVNDERADITTLRFGGSADFGANGFRRFVETIKPLWAGMNGESCASSSRPVCSSLAHISTIPRFPQFSYWSRHYDTLFAGKLAELSRFDFCRVLECADGLWIEFEADSTDDLDAKSRIAERFLLSDDLWDGGACCSNAVWLALHNTQSLADAAAWKERWRKERESLASERQEEILATVIQAVGERGVKRREGDLCAIVSYNDGSVGTVWIETSFQGMEDWVRRAMAAKLVDWGVILCDFSAGRGKSREVTFTATVYDSLMNKVNMVKASAK